jgi:hypothetical protein
MKSQLTTPPHSQHTEQPQNNDRTYNLNPPNE